MSAKKVNGFVVLLGGLVGLVALVLIAAYASTSSKLNRHVKVDAALLTAAPPTPDRIAQGKAIANALGCMHCHTDNLSGKYQLETGMLGSIYSTNLTPGGRRRSVADWALAVRHGLRPDGTALVGMPTQAYADMSDEDLGAIIAYMNSLPAVNKQWPARHLNPMGHLLIGAGIADIAAVSMPHNIQPVHLQPGVSVERGKYRSKLCTICHASDFGGLPPGFAGAAGPNLTRSGEPGHWTEADFVRTIRTGVNPAGRQINKMVMPWDTFRDFSDDDLRSIWAYIQTMPPSKRGATGIDPTLVKDTTPKKKG
jgi:mono/diheme cytochrome c family protein